MQKNGVMVLSPVEVQNFIEQTVQTAVEKVVQEFKLLEQKEAHKEILTIDEASELLNLAKPTIYTLTSRGEIPYNKVSKKLLFKYSDLMAWVDSGRCKTNAELQKEAEAYVKRNLRKR